MDRKKKKLCKCIEIEGHMDAVKWLLWPRTIKPSPGPLAIGDWTNDPFIWMHYVESNDQAFPVVDIVLIDTHSRYWSTHDVQRYFVGNLHCETVIFAYQYPNLQMPTKLGSYLWKTNIATKLFTTTYTKNLNLSVDTTLKKIEHQQIQIDRLIISDQLIHIVNSELLSRKMFFRVLCNILSVQDRLQLVSFENLRCLRLEGVRLIQQLACFNADTLKYLFLWDFVLPNENPILINYRYITGTGQYIPRPKTACCFLRSLGALNNLKILALEYAHIADEEGTAILSLLPIMKKPHFQLQLICRETFTPGKTDAALGVGGYEIPDTAWRRVTIECPDIHLHMTFLSESCTNFCMKTDPVWVWCNFLALFCVVFVCKLFYYLPMHQAQDLIRDYENVRRFLTPSIPLRETHLEYAIDLKMKQRQDSDLSCFVRHLAYRYGDILSAISIHQWRFATFPLIRILEQMPHLRRVYYIGQMKNEVELRKTLETIACGVFSSTCAFSITTTCATPCMPVFESCADSDPRFKDAARVLATCYNKFKQAILLYL